jgi:hypothetical protein
LQTDRSRARRAVIVIPTGIYGPPNIDVDTIPAFINIDHVEQWL